jgi:hypothetical protein
MVKLSYIRFIYGSWFVGTRILMGGINMEENNEPVNKSAEPVQVQPSETSEPVRSSEPKHEVKAASSNGVSVKKGTLWMTIAGILFVLLVASIVTKGFGFSDVTGNVVLTPEDASEKAVTFINDNLLQPGTEATVKSVEEESNLYRVKLDIGGREFDSYLTLDGGLLFPSAVNLNEEVETPEATETPSTPPPTNVEKSDKPKVEVFVMSHCPYGTQIEKGILPVMNTLGDKADIEIKFVNYAMHGEKEIVEQLNQYCIQEEYEDKYFGYLTCFLEAGDGEACLKKAGLSEKDIETCVEETDKEHKITESFEDPAKAGWKGRFPPFNIHDEENQKYGVRGSPTLVLNGAQASSARDAQSLLRTICGAFNDAPEECNTDLSGEGSPSPGFGFTPSAGTAAAAAAACAT